jgi:hypothetical protein
MAVSSYSGSGAVIADVPFFAGVTFSRSEGDCAHWQATQASQWPKPAVMMITLSPARLVGLHFAARSPICLTLSVSRML